MCIYMNPSFPIPPSSLPPTWPSHPPDICGGCRVLPDNHSTTSGWADRTRVQDSSWTLSRVPTATYRDRGESQVMPHPSHTQLLWALTNSKEIENQQQELTMFYEGRIEKLHETTKMKGQKRRHPNDDGAWLSCDWIYLHVTVTWLDETCFIMITYMHPVLDDM